MTLLDLLDQYQGRGISLPASGTDWGGARRLKSKAAMAPVVPAIDDAAANSRERGAPERVDINNFVPQPTAGGGFGAAKLPPPMAPGGASVPFQVAEVAGKSPGFVLERPLALVGELTEGPDGGGSVLDAAAENPILKFVGEAWANVSGLPAALINNKDAITLRQGFAEGWQDDYNIHGNVKGAQAQTWRDFKAEMVKKGYTDQDILDLQSGRKQTTDFGDHRMSGNDLAELALRLGTDPTNLLLGAGVALKGIKGVGFLAKAMDAGIVARRFGAPSLAADAAARGVAAESTLLGMSRYLGMAARGGFSAYKKVALGTTGAQLGVGLIDKGLNGDGAPKSGFLEGLFDFNRSLWDNQPLSNSSGFSILSAFAFNPFHGLRNTVKVIGEAKYRVMGASVREEMIRALQEGESWGSKRPTRAQVLERIGGEDALDNLLVHAHAQMVHGRLMENPAIADSLRSFKSQPEIVLANHKLKEMIEGIIVDEYQRNVVKGRDVVQSLRDWHANRSGVKTGGIEFQWDGALAIDRWNEYGAAVSPVSKIFQEQGTALLGLVDAVMAEDLRNVASALRIASGGGKDVGIAELRKHISRFPQLASEEGGLGKYLLPEWNDKRVPVGPIYGRLKKLGRDAPTARSMTAEFAAAEWKAGREEYHSATPQTPTEVVAPGGVMVGVSRMRPSIARRIKMIGTDYESAIGARSAPEVAAFEHRAGKVLADAGLPVSRVDQAIGSWQGSFEPSLEVGLRGGTIEEIRLTAALLGHAAGRESTSWAATGRDLVRLGVRPNGYEIRLALPDVQPAQLAALGKVLHDLFPGWTLNDTVGAVRVLVPGGTEAQLAAKLQILAPVLEGIYPRESLQSAFASSIHPAYIEALTSKKGAGNGTYTDAFRDARAAGDPRGGTAAANRFRSLLAERNRAPADAATGLGPDASVGRTAGDAGGAIGDLSKSPAERVGPGLDWDVLPAEKGYVYHVTQAEAIEAIAGDGLRPQGPEFRQGSGTWHDGGTGRRAWFTDKPEQAGAHRLTPEDPLLRVRAEDAGHIRRDVVSQDPYSMKRIPAQLVEIYGADGAWHRLDGWTEPVLSPDMAAAAEVTLPVFRKAIQAAYDNGDTALGQQLNRKAGITNGGTVESGGATLGAEGLPSRPLGELEALDLERYAYTPFNSRKPTMDAAIEAAVPLRSARTFYRGVDAREVDLIRARLGGVYSPQKYTSMAAEAITAEGFAGPKGGTLFRAAEGRPGQVVRIELPAGARALDLNAALRESEHVMSVTREIGADDWLLPHSSSFRVSEEGGQLILRLDPAGSVSRPATVRFDPTPDPTTAALRAMEDGRPASHAAGEVSPEESLAQDLFRELDATDPARGRMLFNAALDAEATAQFPLHRSLHGETAAVKAELAVFERQLREEYPAYTLQKPPHPAISIAEGGSLAAQYLRNRTALGDILAEWGPMGNASRLIGWLRTPVRNSVLGRAARQALMNELIPHGAKPTEVQQFLAALDKAAALQEIGPHDVRVFRNGGSMTPKAINKIAAGDPESGIKAIFSDETITAIGRNNFARILDRSGNRFIRTLEKTSAQGGARGALARGLASTYDGYSATAVGGAQRLVSKTLYHWFRFMSDPRWWAMNVLEADMIGGLKFGAGSTRFTGAHKAPVGQAALTHQFGRRAEISQDFERALGDSNGWLYTRRLGGYISRSFDHERPESTLEVLHSLQKDDHVLADLRNVVATEDALAGRAVRSAGEIADEDLVGAIDRMLYSFDEKGAKATILDEARQILGPDETLRLMPFLQKVYEANDKTYRSIVELFHGNPERTNIERIANSYWLYWPLSYQIKATKWLVRVLGEGVAGQKTNLAGAALFAHHVQQHRERMAKDPSYASLFEDHPTAWFLVQMLFPVTPVDIGVSLSRPLRYAGGALGIWGEYKNAQDPISAAGAVLSLGPVYTAELMERLGRELYDEPTENLITQPANNLYPQQ